MLQEMMMNRLLAALGAAALVAPVMATANPLAGGQVTVETADLDLATADGQARLNKRVARAAETVCGRDMDRIHLSAAAKSRACQSVTLNEWQARNALALNGAKPVG